MNDVMKLKRVTFDAAFPDGLLKTSGYGFEWGGMKFAVHRRRTAYRSLGDHWVVSHVGTGFGLHQLLNNPATRKEAFEQAVIGLEMAGAEKVAAAVEKALSQRVEDRLTC